MSEARLLVLVSAYPHPTALARHAKDGAVFGTLGALERRGLVRRDRGQYRLTRRGRSELALGRAIAQLLARG